jgi:hypothetical protein
MRVGQSDRGLRQLVVETVSSTTRLEPLSTQGKNIGIEKWDSSRHELGSFERCLTIFIPKCGIYLIAPKWTY